VEPPHPDRQHADLERVGPLFRLSKERCHGRIVRIDEHRRVCEAWDDLLKELDALRVQLAPKERRSGNIRVGPAVAGHEAALHRIADDRHHDRDGRRRLLRRKGGWGSLRDDDVDLQPDQLGGEGRQAVVVAVGPPVFDGDVLPHQVPVFLKALDERIHEGRVPRRRGAAQEADPVGASRRLRGGRKRDAEKTHAKRAEQHPTIDHPAPLTQSREGDKRTQYNVRQTSAADGDLRPAGAELQRRSERREQRLTRRSPGPPAPAPRG
jgi:hypothetical protein